MSALFRARALIKHIGQVRYESSLTAVSIKDGVKRITLNNPKKRNALSLAMLNNLSDNIFKDEHNETLRCIVLQSEGSVFSSGHDLKELYQSNEQQREEIFRKCSELMIGLRNVSVPVIAVINGLAAAAGCQLVASCDITIATTKSQFSTPGASVGLFCSTPGIAISRNIPLKVASYMLFTGNAISAKEALQYSLVSKVVEEDNLHTEVEKVLQSILSKSKPVIALGKKFFYQQLDREIREAYCLGSEVMVENSARNEAKEGITAFFEKRPPKW